MPRAPRIQFAGAFYHVYNRGVDKLPIVFDDRDRRTFMQILADTVGRYSLRLFAYCLMTNHYHLYFQDPSDNLEEIMWFLQLNFSRYLNGRHDRVGPLFQSRYQSKIVDSDAYSLVLIRYIHQNPLEGSLATHLEDYAWSSYASYIGKLTKWDWLETDWVLRQLHPERNAALQIFRRFHGEKPSKREFRLLSRVRGILGDSLFMSNIAQKVPGTFDPLKVPGTF